MKKISKGFQKLIDAFKDCDATVLASSSVMFEKIHWSDYSSQPEVRIACDQSYDRATLDVIYDNIFVREDKKLYSFEKDEVTCKECKRKIEENEGK